MGADMKINFRKIGVYAKLAVISVLLFAVLVFMASNRNPIEVKFFNRILWRAPGFALILASMSFGVIVFWVGRRIRGVLSDIRNLRREEKAHRKIMDEIKANEPKQGDQQK